MVPGCSTSNSGTSHSWFDGEGGSFVNITPSSLYFIGFGSNTLIVIAAPTINP